MDKSRSESYTMLSVSYYLYSLFLFWHSHLSHHCRYFTPCSIVSPITCSALMCCICVCLFSCNPYPLHHHGGSYNSFKASWGLGRLLEELRMKKQQVYPLQESQCQFDWMCWFCRLIWQDSKLWGLLLWLKEVWNKASCGTGTTAPTAGVHI